MKPILPFGKYLLLERISVGGMAEVFKARPADDPESRLLAIKRILPSMAEDADFITMFIDEARISGQLNHPNIAQIYELSQVGESHFIAMEFVWGKDVLQMQNRFRRLKSTMPFPMAAFIAARMCEALDYAHKKKGPDGSPLGIIHRDVSPQNVLCSYQGEVKVIDFGIAKAASRSTKTQAGVLKGKFGYMSPEQVSGLPLDRRSDVFAIGTILYEMITADRLFIAESDFATLEKVRNVGVKPPGEAVPGCPAGIDRIIRKALEKSVDDRYQWAEDMAADLNEWLAALPERFGERELAAWMQEHFAVELKRETQALEEQQAAAMAHARGAVQVAAAAAAMPALAVAAGGGGGGGLHLVPAVVPHGTQELAVDAIVSAEALGGEPELAGEATQIMSPEAHGELPLSAQATMIADGAHAQQAVRAALAAAGLGELSTESTRILAPDEALPPLSRPQEEMPSQATAILDASALHLPPMILPTPQPVHIAPVPQPMGQMPSGPIYGTPPSGQLAFHPPTTRVEAPLPYQQRKSTWRSDVLIGFAVAALIVGGALGWRYFQKGPRGTLVVAVSPPSAARVFVDGLERGSIEPGKGLTLRDLPAGTHRLEIKSAAGSYAESVEVISGDISPVTAALVPPPDEKPVVPPPPAPSAPPHAAPQEPSHAPAPGAATTTPPVPAQPEVPAHPPSVTLVARPDEKSAAAAPTPPAAPAAPAAPEVKPPAAPAPTAEVKPTTAAAAPESKAIPGKARLQVKTEPPGADVSILGKPVGVTPLDVNDVEPGKAVRVTIRKKGFATVAKYLDFEKEPDRVLDLTLVPAREGAAEAAPGTDKPAGAATAQPPAAGAPVPDIGYLVANTQPWAKVIIDGKDTGKSTPIAPISKLSLKPGKHTITFVAITDGKKYSYPIEIKAGETLRVIKTLGGDAPSAP